MDACGYLEAELLLVTAAMFSYLYISNSPRSCFFFFLCVGGGGRRVDFSSFFLCCLVLPPVINTSKSEGLAYIIHTLLRFNYENISYF